MANKLFMNYRGLGTQDEKPIIMFTTLQDSDYDKGEISVCLTSLCS